MVTKLFEEVGRTLAGLDLGIGRYCSAAARTASETHKGGGNTWRHLLKHFPMLDFYGFPVTFAERKCQWTKDKKP